VTRRTSTPVKNADRNPIVFSIAKIQQYLEQVPGMNAEKAAQIQYHWQAMVNSPDRTDLTRLEKPADIMLKHYLDSAMPLCFTALPSPLLDIGSGAGFPGIILKILSPETHIILGEVRPKRTQFMESVIRHLGLTGIEVYPHRIGPQFPLEIKGIVTRALETSRDTLYRVQPFLPQGGRVILLKGPRGEDEIKPALSEMSDFALEKCHKYNLAATNNERCLVIFERRRESVRASATVTKSASTGSRLEITSRANEHFKMLMSLLETRGIRKQGLYLVSGEKLVQEILADKLLRNRIKAILSEPGMPAVAHDGHQTVLAPQLFRELDVLGTRHAIALMQVPEIEPWDGQSEQGITVFLPFQDPGNIGAAIRSAAAFGAKRVVLMQEAASPFLPKAIRAGANAVFHMRLLAGPKLADIAQKAGVFYRLDTEGEELEKVNFPSAVNLIAGIEGYGFRQKENTIPVKIKIAPHVESLNAQSALSIALYEIHRKFGEKP
jgi:16S rRNA (guanine(527)-N(7))-methyltransferase RsmG